MTHASDIPTQARVAVISSKTVITTKTIQRSISEATGVFVVPNGRPASNSTQPNKGADLKELAQNGNP